MADSIMAEIAGLMNEIETRPANRHELYLALRAKLNELRAMGMPVPDDLVRFERELEAELKLARPNEAAQRPGRGRKTHRR